MTYDVFSLFATDEAAEEKGRPFTEEFGGAITLYLARTGNRRYQELNASQYKAHQYTLDRANAKDATDAEKAAGEALSIKIIAHTMSQTILLGWDTNQTNGDGSTTVLKNQIRFKGEMLPYSHENAEKLLSLKEFRARVQQVAGNYEKFLVEAEEADAKNSAPVSTGTSAGAPVSSS